MAFLSIFHTFGITKTTPYEYNYVLLLLYVMYDTITRGRETAAVVPGRCYSYRSRSRELVRESLQVATHPARTLQQKALKRHSSRCDAAPPVAVCTRTRSCSSSYQVKCNMVYEHKAAVDHSNPEPGRFCHPNQSDPTAVGAHRPTARPLPAVLGVCVSSRGC